MSARTPKEIGRLAGRLFNAVMPAHWAVRSQEDQEDYGIDYEIELTTDKDKATGFIFKVQQKGVENAIRLSDGSISFNDLPTEKVAYYLKQVRIPIVFVVVDLASSKSYWTHLHGNREIEASLQAAVANSRTTMTVHVPAANVFPETADEMLASVRRMFDALTLEAIKMMPTSSVQQLIASESNLDELERGLRFTQSLLRSTRTQRLIDQRAYDEAYKLNENAFDDEEEPPEIRFASGEELIRIAGGLAIGRGAQGREEMLSLRMNVHGKSVAICRRLPSEHQLRVYSLFLARTARLRILIDRDIGLFFGLVAQDAESIGRQMTAAAQRDSTIAIARELHRAQRLLNALIDHAWYGLVPYAWNDLIETLIPFLTRLSKDGLTTSTSSIRGWLDGIGAITHEIAVQFKDHDMLALWALNHVRVDLDGDSFGGRVTEGRAAIASISDARARDAADARLSALVEIQNKPETQTAPEDDPQALEDVIRQIARGYGVNYDDPNDATSRIIRIGVADANPERVLRNCVHLVVQLGSHGIPAELFQLPTAGSKYVVCGKHGFRTSGMSLDTVYGLFKSSHCDGCPDHEAHADGWKWTREWQETSERALEVIETKRRQHAQSLKKPVGDGR